MDLTLTVTRLIELQKQRKFFIKSQSRVTRSCEAFMARSLNYHADLPESERKAIWKRVGQARKAMEEGKDVPEFRACIGIVHTSQQSRKMWDDLRTKVEKEMRELAMSLPVYSWVKTVKGFGELGLAIIVGEVGDLAGYPSVETVWKRLGLAVFGGERQQRRSGDEGILQGYNPSRRAEVWAICSDSMFKHQWRGADEEKGLPARAIGRYGACYAYRKAATDGRSWSAGRRDNDAKRVMTKCLIEDLWRVWNGYNVRRYLHLEPQTNTGEDTDFGCELIASLQEAVAIARGKSQAGAAGKRRAA